MMIGWRTLEDVPAYMREAYARGFYAVPVPPVCTMQWTALDWIKYINRTKGWTCEYNGREQK